MGVQKAEGVRTIQVRGDSAWATAGTARIPINEIQPLGVVPGGVTYVKNIRLSFDMVLTESSGADQTVAERRAQDMIDSIQLHVPGYRAVYDLTNRAGSKMHNFLHLTRGKRPRGANGGGTLTCTKSTTTTVRGKLEIPFYFPGFERPDDFLMPIDLLRDASLEIRWGVTAMYAADLVITSGALRAQVDLVEKNEFVLPTRFSVANMELSGINEQIPVEGRVLLFLAEIPENAATGLTDNVITDAERNNVTCKIDGRNLVDRIDAIDLAEKWNAIHPPTRDDELPNVEGDTGPFVPIIFPDAKPARTTYAPLPLQQPQLVVDGSDTTPHIIYMVSELNSRTDVLDLLTKSGVVTPPGMTAGNAENFLSSKSKSKSAVRAGPTGAERLPIRLHAQPVR